MPNWRAVSWTTWSCSPFKSVTDLKGLQNQVTQGTAHELGMPLAGDIAGLFERLQSTEHRILDRLRAIEDRLKAIESKQR